MWADFNKTDQGTRRHSVRKLLSMTLEVILASPVRPLTPLSCYYLERRTGSRGSDNNVLRDMSQAHIKVPAVQYDTWAYHHITRECQMVFFESLPGLVLQISCPRVELEDRRFTVANATEHF